MANLLIGHNVARVEPDRFLEPMPAKGDGIVEVRQFPHLAAEADWLAEQIQNEIGSGVPPGHVIVLSPDRHLSRPLLARLKDAEIPVRFCFEENELDSPEARNRLGILGWSAHRDDRVLLRYLVGESSQNWRSKQWLRIVKVCREEGKTPVEVLEEVAAGRKIPHTRQLTERYVEIAQKADALIALHGEELVSEWLPPAQEGETEDPLADLRETAMAMVEADPDTGAGDLHDALRDAITQPEVPDQVAEVRIMSLHKSKGLSANVVVVTGLVEGGIPRHPSDGLTDAEKDAFMEEQRRLLYVGLTRVKADPEDGRPGRLILSHIATAPTEILKRSGLQATAGHGGFSSLLASRFLAEISAPPGAKG